MITTPKEAGPNRSKNASSMEDSGHETLRHEIAQRVADELIRRYV